MAIPMAVRFGAVAVVAAGVAAAMVVATPVPDVANTATFVPAQLRPYEAPARRAAVPIAGKRWNVVVVLTDDQPRGMTLDMPNLRRFITARGVQYPNAFVETSTCCPSRASFLTGRFVSGHGVQDNEATGAPGGYRVFRHRGNEQRSLAVEMKRAGYTTGLFGKYLNEYGAIYQGGKPPGWDTWRVFTSLERGIGYRNFAATYPKPQPAPKRKANRKNKPVDAKVVAKKAKEPPLVDTPFGGYSTRWAGKETARFIANAPKRKPVFAVYTPFAPHAPAKPEPKYRGTLLDDGWWVQDPGLHETDVSDKPIWLQRKVRVAPPDGGKAAKLALRQRETLRTVDDQIGAIVEALRKSGRWRRTLFVFTSDNGLMNGVHGEPSKSVPHRRATEVPLMIRYGTDLPPITDERAAAANVDVTATILAVAGRGKRLASLDGVPLVGAPGRSGVPLAGPARDNDGWSQRPPYCGWRTPNALYVRYGSGEEEYYDYTTDPHELTNRAQDPAVADRVQAMRQQARKACADPPTGYGPTFDKPTWTYRERDEPPRLNVTPWDFKTLKGVKPED